MYCLTRNHMKFGDFFIPEGTRALIISDITGQENNSNFPLKILINLSDITDKPFPFSTSDFTIYNELEELPPAGITSSVFSGIIIDTNRGNVYIDAGAAIYREKELSQWEVEKMFGGDIPAEIIQDKLMNGNYKLYYILYYLIEEFSNWVHANCEFKDLSPEDFKNGVSTPYVGNSTLTEKGMKQFQEKKLAFQAILQRIGFTYDFDGGLIFI